MTLFLPEGGVVLGARSPVSKQSATLNLGISSCLSVIWAKSRWAVPEVSGHAQVKRDLKLDVDGPLYIKLHFSSDVYPVAN